MRISDVYMNSEIQNSYIYIRIHQTCETLFNGLDQCKTAFSIAGIANVIGAMYAPFQMT